MTGPSKGPVKAAFAKTGNAKTLSSGLQRSEIDPPAHVSGVDPNNPARKRKANCAPIFGANAAPRIKHMYTANVTMYTGLRPTVSEMGPAKRAPTPKPMRKRPVARDSVTGET
jgi:hypothetical protein